MSHWILGKVRCCLQRRFFPTAGLFLGPRVNWVFSLSLRVENSGFLSPTPPRPISALHFLSTVTLLSILPTLALGCRAFLLLFPQNSVLLCHSSFFFNFFRGLPCKGPFPFMGRAKCFWALTASPPITLCPPSS